MALPARRRDTAPLARERQLISPPRRPQTSDPRVAVVIASRDRRELLQRTLARLAAVPEHPRVVVVDNGSTDGSDAAAAAAGADVIRLPGNQGGAARNVGMRSVAAPYVALCDDDSWWEPGALSRAADLLDRHPRLAAINARILVGPDQRLDPVCAEMASDVLPRGDGQPGHPVLSFIACGVVLRRSAVLAVGGFSERFGIGGEEELLSWDLAAAGWQMSYVPAVVARHDPPPNDGRPERRARMLRNALWLTWLRRPAGTAAARTLHILRRSPADRHTAAALAQALAGLGWVARERRVIPPHVEAAVRLLERS
jgi:N-acetylglucosaminyl-diphospho-decaprenol L-rhamnosyltransferase